MAKHRAKRAGINKPSTKAKAEAQIAAGAPVLLWYLAVIPSLLSFGYTIMRGSDLWWHVAVGRWIFEHKSLPLVDSWSFTREGQPWLQHEWLSDFVFELFAACFGMNFLVYLKWLILLATFLLLFRMVQRITKESISSYLSILLAVAVASPFLDIRPHLFSALGYVVLLNLTMSREKAPMFLPLLFLVWVNLHAGFFFGLMALFVVLCPVLVFGPAADRGRAILIWFSSAAICLVNPNGIKTFAYPLKYAFDRSSPFKAIDEWQRPFVAGGIQSALYPYAIGIFVIAALFLVTRRWRVKKELPWVGLALGFLTLAMSLTSRRFIVLFAISQALLTGPALAELIAPRLARIPRLLPPAAALLLGIIWLWPYPLAPYAFQYLTAEDEFPIETCNFIEANNLSGNVFSYYNWGGYLHLRTNGRMKVFIDGRADTIYDADTFRRYALVQGFHPGWENVLEQSGAQYILWPRNNTGKPLAALIASGRWRVLYDDFVSVLLVRVDRQPLGPFEPTPDSAYRRLTSGVKNLEAGRYVDAEAALKSSLKLMPYLRTALLTLAQVQSLQGKTQEAGQTLDRCDWLFPDQPRVAIARAALH